MSGLAKKGAGEKSPAPAGARRSRTYPFDQNVETKEICSALSVKQGARRKPKKPGKWWEPPRGTEAWLLALVEYVMEEEKAKTDRSWELMRKENPQRYSTELRGRFEEEYGRSDRLSALWAALSTAIDDDAQKARVRLWMREGWTTPSAPPDDFSE